MANVKTISGVTVDVPAHTALLTAIHGITVVRKTADETVNNSDTLQNDNELLFAIAANEVWVVLFLLIHKSSTVADLKVGFSLPAGADLYGWGTGYNAGGSFVANEWTETATPNFFGAGATSAVCNSLHQIIVINGATAGNFQLQWAQNTAEVSDTKVLINSFLIAQKIA